MFVYCNLFNAVVSNSDYVTPYDWMLLNSELEMNLKGTVTAYFKVLPRYFPDETEEDHEIPHLQ